MEGGSGGPPQMGVLGRGGLVGMLRSGLDLSAPLPVASVSYGAVFLWAISLPHTLGAGHSYWHCAGETGELNLIFKTVEGIDSIISERCVVQRSRGSSLAAGRSQDGGVMPAGRVGLEASPSFLAR